MREGNQKEREINFPNPPAGWNATEETCQSWPSNFFSILTLPRSSAGACNAEVAILFEIRIPPSVMVTETRD